MSEPPDETLSREDRDALIRAHRPLALKVLRDFLKRFDAFGQQDVLEPAAMAGLHETAEIYRRSLGSFASLARRVVRCRLKDAYKCEHQHWSKMRAGFDEAEQVVAARTDILEADPAQTSGCLEGINDEVLTAGALELLGSVLRMAGEEREYNRRRYAAALRMFEDAKAMLSEPERALLEGRYEKQLSTEELATATGIPLRTLERHEAAARRRFAKALRRVARSM